MTLHPGQPLWARYFSQQTAGYVVKPLGKVQRIEPGRVMVAGRWYPTASLGRGIYTSPEHGEADIAAHPLKVPTAPGT